MRPRIATWLAVFLVLPALAWAQAAPQAPDPARDIGAADRGTIRAVITEQIAAFRRDDAAAAFGFAAPNIQAMFGSPERFLSMVRDSYQPVYRPSDVAFGELVRIDGQLIQLVQLVGPDGAPRLALYFMERQPDGTWRIAGCTLTAGQGVTT
jgi:ketosteroid isomerase-like protein